MIIPTPRDEAGRQRAVAMTGSTVLMLALAVALRSTPLPAFESSRAVIRQIDPLFIERFAAPPPPASHTPEPASAERSSTAGATETALDPEVGSALDRLGARLGVGAGTTDAVASDAARRAAPGAAIGRIEGNSTSPRFDELFGAALEAPTVAGRTRARPAPDGVQRDGIELSARIRERDPLRPEERTRSATMDVAPDASTGRARPRREATLPNVAITAHAPERFDALAADQLASWLRSHADDLPVGVRVHLRQQPSFLTASAPFKSGGRTLELYLMYNPGLRELHIVLVEGDRSVYLIDRGAQTESRWLREGTVHRVNGEIVSVNSQAKAATSARAQEFFSIFMSWWEVARQDVGR